MFWDQMSYEFDPIVFFNFDLEICSIQSENVNHV